MTDSNEKTEASAPREFWVIENAETHTGLMVHQAFKVRQKFIRFEPKPQIHVIEYSAFERERTRADKAEAERDRWKERHQRLSASPSDFQIIEDLGDKLAEARKEVEEECRINALGQERELKLMTKLADAKRVIGELRAALKEVRKWCTRETPEEPCTCIPHAALKASDEWEK